MSIHLHCRSAYSLLNSTLSIPQLVTKAKTLGFNAVALTDHNSMHGAMEFYKCCQANAMKPIIGLEADIEMDEQVVPFLILAKNDLGFQECMRISTFLSTQNKAVSFHQLNELTQNCVIIVYGEGGYLEQSLITENMNRLSEQLLYIQTQIKDFYVALSNNDSNFWRIKNEELKKVCVTKAIKTVALSKIYYGNEEDEEVYKIVCGIRQGLTLKDKSLISVPGRWMRSEADMIHLYHEDDLLMSETIADLCHVEMHLQKASLPVFKTPTELNSAQYLTQLCIAGMKKRFPGNALNNIHKTRLKYELDIIISMNYADYFLIVWDFIRFSRKSGIYVGPGRGSAAGSLVAYVLGITHVDPIEHGLLFERFLNPERISMPDIDTDFPDNRRDEVIQYVAKLYGEQHVAHISTFGTLGAKQVLRDVGRVMGLALSDMDMLCKAVPFAPKMTLGKALKESSRFAQYIQADHRFQKLMEIALKIEGLPRHCSTHAAGIVMSSLPLQDVVPCIQIENDLISTQYTMEYLEELGLIKMDFLGLRNLTIIDEVVQQIQAVQDFDIMKIPMNDTNTFQLIRKVDTVGVFQLESEGMKNLIRKMQPTVFADIVATVALFRPGPMENIPEYLRVKADASLIRYPHPDLKEILEETYGVMIYQEQIMQVAQKMAGFSLGKADILRKAMSKKKLSELQALQKEFIEGCIKQGYQENVGKDIYELVLKFANYGFNKAHSVAYGLIAYQMAFLKANYPLFFFASLLNSVIGSEVKTSEYIDECRRRQVQVLAPSVNLSQTSYLIKNQSIIFPLLGIKGMGNAACNEIIKERNLNGVYLDYYDFIARISAHKINKKTIEALINAGALDEFKLNRRSMLASIDEALVYADLVRIEVAGQSRIDLGLVSKPVIISISEDLQGRSMREKEALGFYLSNHPIMELRKQLQVNYDSIIKIAQRSGQVQFLGCITRVKQHRTKNGDMMAFVSVMDETGDFDIVIMPNLFQEHLQNLVSGNYFIIEGKIDRKDSCLVNKLKKVNFSV